MSYDHESNHGRDALDDEYDADEGAYFDGGEEDICADCGKQISSEDVCGVCGVAMCFACFEMGAGVCKGPHR